MFSVLTFAEATYGSEQFRSAVSPVTVSCYVDDIYLLSGAGGGYELRRARGDARWPRNDMRDPVTGKIKRSVEQGA
jgi:hypothetical protein